jgi:hypothetical protein
MDSENVHECTQNPENAFGFEFFKRNHKYGDEFFNKIVRVTCDETCVSFMNVETKEHSKQWMHTYSPNKPKILKKCCLLES